MENMESDCSPVEILLSATIKSMCSNFLYSIKGYCVQISCPLGPLNTHHDVLELTLELH